MSALLANLAEIRPADVADILLVALVAWAGIAWLRTTRARLAVVGIGILLAFYAASRQLGLQLTTRILQAFSAVAVLVIVVVFQEELRRLFERIGAWGLRRRITPLALDATDSVVRAVAHMARTRTGALIVLPGRDPLDIHVDGGIPLGGAISEPLLLSIFDTSSPGHDGAVLLRGGRVERFALHLPLSANRSALGPGGTRHAAALGLAEACDALSIAVSEERGTVSVAQNGRIRVLRQPEELARVIRGFVSHVAPVEREGVGALVFLRRIAGRWREGLAALAIALGSWTVFVAGDAPGEITRNVPVVVQNLPNGYALEAVDPPEVEVTLEGRRRDLYLVSPEDLQVRIDALLVQLGRRTFQLDPNQVKHPANVRVARLDPEKVRLSVTLPAEPSSRKP
jgi:diadenylate cyclase